MRDGWIEATLRDALEPIANRPDGKDYPLVLSVTEKRGIIPQTEIFKHRIATDDISKYKVLEPMDIAYNPYLLWCGAIGQWQGSEAGIVSPVYECFRVKSNCEPRYLGYVFETGILTNYFDALAIGSIVRRRRTIPSDFIAAPIQLPPLPEQKRIVDLISSVDSYIEALQQQLESAKRSRNAVLHELLTAGSNDWVETSLGKVAQINPEQAKDFDSERLIKYVDLSTVTFDNGIDSKIDPIPFNEAPGRARRIIRENDVIVATVRPYLKGFAFVSKDFNEQIASTGFCVIRAASELILPELVWALVSSDDFVDYLIRRSTGSSYPAVRPIDISEFNFMLPPFKDQETVSQLIRTFDQLIKDLTNLINSTQNLRSGLLSDLLSGEHEIPASYDKVIGAA